MGWSDWFDWKFSGSGNAPPFLEQIWNNVTGNKNANNPWQPSNPGDRPLLGNNPTNPLGALPGANSGLPSAVPGSATQDRTTYLNQLFEQLMQGLKGSVPTMPSDADLRKQASDYASAQYDPQIKAIQREMGRTKGRAKESSADLKELYKELSGAYKQDAKIADADYRQIQAEQKVNAQELQQQIGTGYKDSIASQTDLMKSLGLEQAVPETTRGQQNDMSYLQKLAGTQTQATADELALGRSAGNQYYREGATGALQEGASAIEELMDNLNNYLTQRGDQISGLEGQRQSASNMLFQQLQQQAAQSMASAQDKQWQRLLELGRFRQSLDSGRGTSYKGISGASQLLGEQVGEQKAQQLMGRVNEILQYAGTRQKQDVNSVLNYAANHARNVGLNPQDTLALINAMYAYFGRY